MKTRLSLALAYVSCAVLANVLTAHFGLVPIGFGLLVTSGTFAVGGCLLTRNLGQDALGRRRIFALMAVGVILSWWLASPALAIASAVAFGLSELADMAVYARLNRRPVALPAAALVGAAIDSVVFLHLAGFPLTAPAVVGQVLVKVAVTVAALVIGGARVVLRQSLNRVSA